MQTCAAWSLICLCSLAAMRSLSESSVFCAVVFTLVMDVESSERRALEREGGRERERERARERESEREGERETQRERERERERGARSAKVSICPRHSKVSKESQYLCSSTGNAT